MFSFLFNLNILFTVIMLTALFSITSLFSFVFRKGALKGKESGMYYIWLAVLVLAFVPIRLSEPSFILFPQENRQTQTNDTVNINVNKNIKFSDLILENSLRSFVNDSLSERELDKILENGVGVGRGDFDAPVIGENPKQNFWTDILKSIAENKNIIMSGVIILWLAGFVFVVSRIIYNYFKMKKLFYNESDICENDRVNGIFNECIEIVGLIKTKNRINLRIINRCFSSPCVCGLFKPTVFVDDTCVSLSDKKLKYIFVHELYHIKRYDMLYKILSVIVSGVHWFNPLTYKVVKTISEDCELSVDRHVMKIFGNEQSDYYMNIILDIAESKCAERNRPLINIPSASLFFGEKRNIDFLKRRYNNMKNVANKKYLVIALSIFLTAIISINTIIMSSCGITGTVDAAANAGQLTGEKVYDCADINVYEAALKLYFGLLPDEELTQQQLDEITEIKIIRGIDVNGTMVDSINNIPLGGLTPVSFVINGKEFNMVPSIVHKRVFEGYIIRKFIETYTPENTAYDDDNWFEQFQMSRELAKLCAYYTIKDANAEDITPEAKEELLLEYPITAEYPIAVFDPNYSEREYTAILGFFAECGLLDDNFIQNNTIDAGYLLRLPNLKKATFVNINNVNVDLLNNITNVINEESEYVFVDENGYVAIQGNGDVISIVNSDGSQNESSQPQGPSGIFEAPDYGINIADDGTEYLEFKNQSLYAALMEYFELDRWYGSYITPDMLSQIYSIDIKIKPEYNYIYDNIGLREEFNLDCQYIEYTINGKTLDILPEKFMEGGVIEPIFDENISEYFDYESGYYITKPDLGEIAKRDIYYDLAYNAAMRIPVYLNDDGSYFTSYSNGDWHIWSMYLLGFPARYYDKDEYDATDIAYMPNLTEFNVDGLPVK